MNLLQHEDAGHPLWALGYVDPYGAVHGRGSGNGHDGDAFHSEAEKVAGRPFRFNVWLQEYETFYGKDRLSPEDRIQVENWLASKGWLDAENDLTEVSDTGEVR